MSIDRATLADGLNDTKPWRDAGFDPKIRWTNFIGSGDPGYIDPQPDENWSRFFKYNPSEARKLLDAAGYQGKRMNVVSTYGDTAYPELARHMEAVYGMLKDNGWDIERKPLPYQQVYIGTIHQGKNQFEGMSYSVTAPGPGATGSFRAMYNPSGIYPHVSQELGDATMFKMIDDLSLPRDAATRVAGEKEVQKYMAGIMPVVPFTTAPPTIDLFWPWVGNAGVFSPAVHLRYWVDSSKKKA
jgi:ABC-type transport system substrate-binding protein